ncbi:DUF1609 domain-containing protein [Encephalitozoon intestinalis]|nr:DUF1609 domain-containing protein [Encephalitozoon intestinalis]
MKTWIVCIGILIKVMCSSEGAKERLPEKGEYSKVEEVPGFEKKIIIPFVFHGKTFAVSPVCRYQDVSEEEREYVEEVVDELPSIVWNVMVWARPHGHSEWIMAMGKNFLIKKMFPSIPNPVELYKGGKGRARLRFGELVMKIFQENSRMMGKFGECLQRAANMRLLLGREKGNLTFEDTKILEKICSYGESLMTREKQEETVKAQRVVWESCKYLWEKKEERDYFSLIVYFRGFYKAADSGRIVQRIQPLVSHGDHSILIDVYDKHGVRAAAEVIKRILIEDRDTSVEKAERIVLEVKKQEKEEREEEEREMKRKEKEFLERSKEFLEKGKETSKRKKTRGKGKKKEQKEEKKEVKEPDFSEEEKEAEERERSSISRKSEEEKGRECYKLHKRVTRWRKDAWKIKEELDKGGEEKWRGKSIEEICEQKEVHDIGEVVELLRSPDGDKFFTTMKDKKEDRKLRKVGIAVLEIEGKAEEGIVEVGIFKNSLGENVVYHLMFRGTGMGSREDLSSLFWKGKKRSL